MSGSPAELVCRRERRCAWILELVRGRWAGADERRGIVLRFQLVDAVALVTLWHVVYVGNVHLLLHFDHEVCEFFVRQNLNWILTGMFDLSALNILYVVPQR